MSHHGNDPKLDQHMNDQFKKMFGEFPNGRLNANDQGAVPVAIGHDKNKRVVTMDFPRNLNWIGFTAEQAIEIAETLIKHARACGSTRPLTVKIG